MGLWSSTSSASACSPSPQQPVDTRQQDGQLERLGQVVVGAGLEPAQYVVGAAARGEHEDRHVLPGGAQLRRRFEAILAGEHDVEDDDVHGHLLIDEQRQRLLAVAGDRHLVPLGLEVEAQPVGDVRLVLHDEDAAHADFGCSATASALPAKRGSSRVKVAPRPSPSLWANTRPPCARAMVRTM